jgi:hypothetical protein
MSPRVKITCRHGTGPARARSGSSPQRSRDLASQTGLLPTLEELIEQAEGCKDYGSQEVDGCVSCCLTAELRRHESLTKLGRAIRSPVNDEDVVFSTFRDEILMEPLRLR